MPTQFGNEALGGNYAMWNRGFWSRKRREEDARSMAQMIEDRELRREQRKHELEQQGRDADLVRDKDRFLYATGLNEGVASRADERRGVVAEGDMTRRKAELDAAGHGARMKVAPGIATSGAEADAIEAQRRLEQSKFDQTSDPTMRQARLEADLARFKGLKSKGLFDADLPGAPIAAQLLDTLMRTDAMRDVAKTRVEKDTKPDLGLKGQGANVMPPSIRIAPPKVEDEAGTGMFDQKSLDSMSQLLKKFGGSGAGAAGGMGGL